MIELLDVEDVLGAPVVIGDRPDGHGTIGTVVDIYLDAARCVPTWAAVATEGGRSLVPIADADWDAIVLHIRVDQDAVLSAPSVESVAEVTPDEEALLVRHYAGHHHPLRVPSSGAGRRRRLGRSLETATEGRSA